jgi:uncharacterized membrane protein YcaP (DUF421 family)
MAWKKGFRSIKNYELIIILGLGKAVSEPMLNPTETFIPQGFTVIIIAIAIFKMYDYLTTRYKKFSKMIVSKPILLVKDGKDSMMKARISKDEFESYLRLSGTDDISDMAFTKKLSHYFYFIGEGMSNECHCKEVEINK